MVSDDKIAIPVECEMKNQGQMIPISCGVPQHLMINNHRDYGIHVEK